MIDPNTPFGDGETVSGDVDAKWDNLGNEVPFAGAEETEIPEDKAEEVKTLPLYTEVYGGYKISSLPFDKKSEAYEEIMNNWQGADVTVYHDNGKYYIISK